MFLGSRHSHARTSVGFESLIFAHVPHIPSRKRYLHPLLLSPVRALKLAWVIGRGQGVSLRVRA